MTKKIKKYIVIGGEVMSKFDFDMHYIGAGRLCVLYDINPKDHYLFENSDPHIETKIRNLKLKGLTVLRPRTDGNYDIQKQM